jgi:hypothetical protein
MKQRNEPNGSPPIKTLADQKGGHDPLYPRALEFNSALGESNEVRRVRQEETKRPKQARQNEEKDFRDAAIIQADIDERRIAALAAARSPSATDQGIEHFKEIVNGK